MAAQWVDLCYTNTGGSNLGFSHNDFPQQPRRYRIPTTPFQESHNGLIQYLVLFLRFHFEFRQTANEDTLFDKIQNAEKQFLHCINTT